MSGRTETHEESHAEINAALTRAANILVEVADLQKVLAEKQQKTEENLTRLEASIAELAAMQKAHRVLDH